jgi:hypothetical protein
MVLNPRPIPPNLDTGLGPHPAPERSLAEELGELVDDARQLNTDFGLRPYRVFSVLYEWSGGAVGKGRVQRVREQEFLPTPLVDLRPVRSTPRNAGKVEEGQVTLREVSPRYTEDQIAGLLFQDGLGVGQEGFVEVQYDRRGGLAKRRRFGVHGVPWHDAEKFEWVVRMVRARPDRKRSGKPNERTDIPERILNPLMAEE